MSLYLEDTPENRAIAIAKARQIERDIATETFDRTLNRYRSIYNSPDTLPLGELWERYTNHKRRSLSITTIRKDYKRVANHIARLPTQDPNDAAIIRKCLSETLTPGAAKKVLQFIKACCVWAVEDGLMRSNPFEGQSLSARQNRPRINPFTLTESEMILGIFESEQLHYLPLVKFALLTGCRPSESAALRWHHIDPDLQSITFSEALVEGYRKDTKTHTIRRFPINAQLRAMLEQMRPTHPDPYGPLFTSPTGENLDTHNFTNRAWKPLLKKLPILYRRFYNCRHTFITRCLERGIPVAVVARWVGNSPKIIFEHYAGFTDGSDVPEF